MDYVEKFLDTVQGALNINPATFSGAVDIVVVQQSDGSFKSTPFHVRFGKFQLLNVGEKMVTLAINDELTDIKMKLGESGSAYFVREVQGSSSPSIGGSPVSTSPPPDNVQLFLEAEGAAQAVPLTSLLQDKLSSPIAITPQQTRLVIGAKSLDNPSSNLELRAGGLEGMHSKSFPDLGTENTMLENYAWGSSSSKKLSGIAERPEPPKPRGLMDSFFSFFSNKTGESIQENEDDEPTTEYYSGTDEEEEDSDDMGEFKEGILEMGGTQFSLEMDSSQRPKRPTSSVPQRRTEDEEANNWDSPLSSQDRKFKTQNFGTITNYEREDRTKSDYEREGRERREGREGRDREGREVREDKEIEEEDEEEEEEEVTRRVTLSVYTDDAEGVNDDYKEKRVGFAEEAPSKFRKSALQLNPNFDLADRRSPRPFSPRVTERKISADTIK
eukprot:TRINITY_DN689_c0_g6_i5.p1 TRINITY_DN689_c0_g6~~TRINITY_DN689_c0_g6_i5.p1  ORF type:complete len:443 (-),score=130.74 TRINITY_DN689_c0_g6_i5:116-1444(-)